MNKRQGFAPILLIILALVISVGGVGIGLAWKTEVLDKILPPNIKEFFGKEITPTDGTTTTDGETQPTPEEIEDLTKDWKVYTDTESGYKIKSPPGWFVYLRAGSGIVDNLDFTWFTSVDISNQLDGGNGAGAGSAGGVPPGEVLVAIGVEGDDKDESETLASWARRRNVEPDITVKEDVVFGGKAWVELSQHGYRVFYSAKGSLVYFFLVDTISVPSAENWRLIELMASTFEIL